MTHVNVHISDLFFNRDLSDTVVRERGDFVGYDGEKLAREATDFLDSLAGLGIAQCTVDELIADFFARI